MMLVCSNKLKIFIQFATILLLSLTSGTMSSEQQQTLKRFDLVSNQTILPAKKVTIVSRNKNEGEKGSLTFSPRTLLLSAGQINKSFLFSDFFTFKIFAKLFFHALTSFAVVAVTQLISYPLFAFASYAALATIKIVSIPVMIASAYGLVALAKYLFPKLKTKFPKYEGPYWKAEIRLRKHGDEDDEDEPSHHHGWPSPGPSFAPSMTKGPGWLPYDTVAFGIPAMDKHSIKAAKKAQKYTKKAKKYAEKASKYAAKAYAAKLATKPLYAAGWGYPSYPGHSVAVGGLQKGWGEEEEE